MESLIQSGEVRVYHLTRANRLCLLLFGVLAPFVFLWVAGIALTRPQPLAVGDITAAVVFILVFVLMLAFTAFHASIHAELSSTKIVRYSMFGRKESAISEIVSALHTSYRGVVFLNVKGAASGIVFNGYSFSNAQLQEMQDLIADLGRRIGKNIQISVPFPAITQKQFQWGGLSLVLTQVTGLTALYLVFRYLHK